MSQHTDKAINMTNNKTLQQLLKNPQALRIALWLKTQQQKNKHHTAKEISQGIPTLSTIRIKQILKKMHEKNWVHRKQRKNKTKKKPGPPPLEYQLKKEIVKVF